MRACALLLVLVTSACGSDDASPEAKAESAGDAEAEIEVVALAGEGTAQPQAAPDAEPAIAYDASKAGLRTLAEDVIEALAANDRARAERIAESLALPDAEAWFGQIFGPALGAKLATAYQPAAARTGDIVATFDAAQKAGQTSIDIDRFPETSTYATGYQALALERMKKPVTLYSIRLTAPDAEHGLHLWSFIHDGETFRWVGKMKALAEKPQLITVTPPGASEAIEVDALELPIRSVAELKQL